MKQKTSAFLLRRRMLTIGILVCALISSMITISHYLTGDLRGFFGIPGALLLVWIGILIVEKLVPMNTQITPNEQTLPEQSVHPVERQQL